MTQGEILKRLIKTKGHTQEQFADKVGLTRATINNLTKQAELSEEYQSQFAKVLGVDKNVFTHRIIPDEVVFTQSKGGDAEFLPRNSGYTILHVPVEAEAGFIGGNMDPVMNDELQPWSIPGYDEPGYSFKVKGDSMFPTFKEGEIVITSRKQEPYDLIRRQFIYVIVTKDQILIKRVEQDKKNPGMLKLFSDNVNYEPISVKYDEVKIYKARRNFSWDLSKKYS